MTSGVPAPRRPADLVRGGDGWRYSLGVTNLPGRTPGWRGQLACIDAAHRVHARVEDCIRTGKDASTGKFPSQAFALNQAWLAAALKIKIHHQARRAPQASNRST